MIRVWYIAELTCCPIKSNRELIMVVLVKSSCKTRLSPNVSNEFTTIDDSAFMESGGHVEIPLATTDTSVRNYKHTTILICIYIYI